MKIKITGGNPLIGTVTPIANKNAILKVLPASVLTKETMYFENVPNTSDVQKILAILEKLGAEVNANLEEGQVNVNCENVNSYEVDTEIGNKFRSSIMFAGPLLARFGKAKIPLPGGCTLGKRSIAGHIDNFKQVGITPIFNEKDDTVTFMAPKDIEDSYKVWPIEAAVTPCENLLLYLGGIEANIEYTGCNTEPHTVQLLETLKSMGAEIEGIKSNFVKIKGSKNLKGTKFITGPDPIDIAGIIISAAITKGDVTIKGANKYHTVQGMVNLFKKFNVNIEQKGEDLIINQKEDLKIIDWQTNGLPMAADAMPKITPRPYPGLLADIIPMMVPLACKTEGKVLINNWMYENGLEFVQEINKIGGKILKLDASKVIVEGPVKFISHKDELRPPFIIQATLAVLLCCLCDDSENIIHDASCLVRRYPDIVGFYNKLGAKIEIIKE